MLRINKVTCAACVVTGILGFMVAIFTFKGDTKHYDEVDLSAIKDLRLYKLRYGLDESTQTIRNLGSNQRKPPSEGKTKVYRHNGQELERLYDFCTWSLPTDCATLKTPGGPMTIYIHDVDEDPGLSGALKKTGERDPENVAIVLHELKKYPDAGFFDFGSHIGVYGLSIAYTLGRQVVSIEALVENTVRLCKSIQKNGLTDKITVVYNPVSNDHSRVYFRRVYHHIGATRVVKTPVSNDSSCDDTQSYSVMLDDLIPIVPFKTAVMKLDVEASEYFAIQGGLKFLKAIDVRSILMEWYTIMQTPHAGPLVDMMRDLGYVPHIPYPEGKHMRVKYEDYMLWRKHRFLLDILWIKQS